MKENMKSTPLDFGHDSDHSNRKKKQIQSPLFLCYSKSGHIKNHDVPCSLIVWHLHGSEIFCLTNIEYKEGPFQDLSTNVLSNSLIILAIC